MTTALALAVPIVGVAMARPVIEVAMELVAQLRAAAMSALEGHYREFDGHPLRVRSDDGELWIAEAGLLAVLEIDRDAIARRRFSASERRLAGGERNAEFSLAGVRRLIGMSRSQSRDRFARWVERELEFPHERRRARGSPDQ